MKPELGPPDVEEIDYPDEDPSWAAEWEHFTRCDRGRRRARLMRRPRRRALRLADRRGRVRGAPATATMREQVARMMAAACSSPAAAMGIGRGVRDRAGARRPARTVVARARARRSRRRVAALAGEGHEALALDVGDHEAWDAPTALADLDAAGHRRRRASARSAPLGDIRPAPRSLAVVRINVVGTLLAVHHCLPALRAGAAARSSTFSGGGATGPLAALRRLRGLQGGRRAPDREPRRRRRARQRRRARASSRRACTRRRSPPAPSRSAAQYFARTSATSRRAATPPERAAELVAFLLSDDGARDHAAS